MNQMEFGSIVRDVVRRLDGRHARIVIMKIPDEQFSMGVQSALYIDGGSGSEIGPRKFFLASPQQLDRFSSGLSNTGSFKCGIAGMFSAVSRAGIRNDDANVGFGNVKGGGEFIANRKGTLRPGPDGQLSVGPFGNRRARLERAVGNIGGGVAAFERSGGLAKAVFERTSLSAVTLVHRGWRIFSEISEEVLTGGLRNFAPLHPDGVQGLLRGRGGRCGCSDQVAIAKNRDAGNFLRGGQITGNHGGSEGRRPEDFAMLKPGLFEIRRVYVASGNEIARARFRYRLGGNSPLGGRARLGLRRGFLVQRFP